MKVFDEKQRDFKISNLVLLITVVFVVFIAPILPSHLQRPVNSTCFTIIFLAAVLSLEKYRNRMFILALAAIFTEWLSEYIDAPLFMIISDLTNFLFFIIVVAGFIAQLVRSQKIGLREILESINGYLLLGIIFAILMAVTNNNIPGAFQFPETPDRFGDYLYYGFITLSTLGYGDVLPKLPIARSLAILTTISGQFYMATIIAIIISKYMPSSKSQKEVN